MFVLQIIAQGLHVKGRCLVSMHENQKLSFVAGLCGKNSLVMWLFHFEKSLMLFKGVNEKW